MATSIEVLVPDIGGFKDVSVIDVLVKEGQQIEKESPLITIETEKAAMDVPAPAAGRVSQVKVKQGDKVSEGSVILLLEPAAEAASTAAATAPVAGTTATAAVEEPPRGAVPATPTADSAAAAPATATVPAAAAPPRGDAPAPATKAAAASKAAPAPAPVTPSAVPVTPAAAPPAAARTPAAIDEAGFSKAYASPSVRKFAREVGADLARVAGTGPKERITQEDVKAHVKRILTAPAPTAPAASAGVGSALPKVPEIDFARFGAVESKPLSRIQRISGARLQASWINLPHVTQYDEADITDLDAVRAALKDKAAQEGVKLTPLVFIIKACIAALQKFPRFNASLDPTGENLIYKKYFHIGFAADTPNGLVVPVIRDADRSDIYQLARALGELSAKARAGTLKAAEMQGGCFTVSSLGGIGGTAFTPIINAPEVAILGVAKSGLKPVYDRGGFIPRLMLPLCLSYDHRVIDGAEAARFIVFLSKALSGVKALL